MLKRKMTACLLALCLVLSLAPAALASAAAPEEDVLQVLAALEVMVGDENGNLDLASPITRAQFAKMAVAASAYKDGVGQATAAPYPDVDKSHWAAGYIRTAVQAGLITGYLDGTFRPDDPIALCDGVVIALRLLGYQNSDFSGAYPSGQMALYRSLDLDEGVSVSENTQILTRRDCAHLFYNLLTAPVKSSGAPYITTLGYPLTASGEIDRVALINASMDGPVVAQGNWAAALGFDPASAAVYRAGARSSYGAIRTYDVVYWSKPMRTLWVYNNRVTGSIDAVSPSAAAPTAVTVAGRSYAIETASAAYDLSDLGSFRAGDSVTLLLGRTGGAAAVLPGSRASEPLYGVVTSTAPGGYMDADGNVYTAGTVTLTATDGESYTYRSEGTDLDPGDLVQVTVSDGGESRLSKLSSASLSGRVDSEGSRLGDHPFADDVQILDVCRQSAVRVYPERLSGVSLSRDQVLYYQLDTRGDISRLILSDVTGDMHTYGVLTDVTEPGAGGVYVYDAGGTPGVIQSARSFGVKKGPMVIEWDGDQAEKIGSLTGVALDSVEDDLAHGKGQDYTVSDAVLVYELRGGDYYLSALDRVDDGGFALTGYYDKAERDGGRIRVIVAQEED